MPDEKPTVTEMRKLDEAEFWLVARELAARVLTPKPWEHDPCGSTCARCGLVTVECTAPCVPPPFTGSEADMAMRLLRLIEERATRRGDYMDETALAMHKPCMAMATETMKRRGFGWSQCYVHYTAREQVTCCLLALDEVRMT